MRRAAVPATTTPAFEAGVGCTEQPFWLSGQDRRAFHDMFPAEVINFTGSCPVLTVPIGRGANGVPIGVQIVGPVYGDRTTIAMAALLEQAWLGFVPPAGWA